MVMMLLPPEPHLCQECATDHEPTAPHNPQSMYYEVKFRMEHGRAPTWEDAMAHCSDEVKAQWTTQLAKFGVIVGGNNDSEKG